MLNQQVMLHFAATKLATRNAFVDDRTNPSFSLNKVIHLEEEVIVNDEEYSLNLSSVRHLILFKSNSNKISYLLKFFI